MAHLREAEPAKRGWLQRIWFPLHTGFPVKILALLIICVSGYYLSRSVETELKQSARQPLPEIPAQQAPHQVQSPAIQDKQERPATALPKTAAPPAAPRQPAPEQTPLQTRTAPAPGAFAPTAPTAKDQYGDKSESMESTSEVKSDRRAMEMAPEMEMKDRRSLQRNIDTAAPAASERAYGAAPARTLPRAMVRLSVADPSAAAPLIREAALRAGGNIAEEPVPSGHLLMIRIPFSRQQELMEQLQQLGRIVERTVPPPGGGGAQLLEMNIRW
jgi:hypothetical protein